MTTNSVPVYRANWGKLKRVKNLIMSCCRVVLLIGR